ARARAGCCNCVSERDWGDGNMVRELSRGRRSGALGRRYLYFFGPYLGEKSRSIMVRKPILKLVPPAEGCACAFFALEPHIRDLHRMAQLAAMAALGGNDERTRFGVFQLERMVDALALLYYDLCGQKTSDPNAQVTRGDCVSTLWRPHGDIRLGSKNCR